MVATLAPDAVLHSPVTFKPFEGKEAISVLFGALLEIFEDFHYTDQFEQDHTAALVFRARVGDRDVEGLDLMRFRDDGLIEDFTVMIRPLSGVQAVAKAVAAKLGFDV
ncbi:MAG: nuclear transport factor 2 family protein [Actinomycetota bacterium]